MDPSIEESAAHGDGPPTNSSTECNETTSQAHCCGKHTSEEELQSLRQVLDAFTGYNQYQRQHLFEKISQFQSLSQEHKALLEPTHSIHTRKLIDCIEHNQKVLDQIIYMGLPAFGELGERASDGESRIPTSHHMGKLQSTLKQIVREWSDAGAAERAATYAPLLTELDLRFPKDNREKIRVLVPGAGLGRLAWEVAALGFDSVANEFSAFMLITSYFILNECNQEKQLTIYPYVSSSSNRWSYEDQTRAVSFPDLCPTTTLPTTRDPPMSMSSGDFLTSFDGDEGKYSAIVTSWFLDTAHNVIDYIEHVNRLLVVGGVWINAGPLLYHYSDTPDELSIELPFDEILRIAGLRGFRIDTQRRLSSLYAGDDRCMMHTKYDCGFFVAIKEEGIEK